MKTMKRLFLVVAALTSLVAFAPQAQASEYLKIRSESNLTNKGITDYNITTTNVGKAFSAGDGVIGVELGAGGLFDVNDASVVIRAAAQYVTPIGGDTHLNLEIENLYLPETGVNNVNGIVELVIGL